jgi:hypothetical protein
MPLRSSLFASLALSLAVASCGAHDDDAHASHGAAGASPGADASATPPDAALLEDATLASPTLDRLMRMDGGLHVMWTNPAVRCVAVVGERASEGEPWREVFRVDGAYDNLHQDGMQAGVLYTYRLRCEQAGRVSPPSNEKSATP